MGVVIASQNEQRFLLCPREEGVSRHCRRNVDFGRASKLILLIPGHPRLNRFLKLRQPRSRGDLQGLKGAV